MISPVGIATDIRNALSLNSKRMHRVRVAQCTRTVSSFPTRCNMVVWEFYVCCFWPGQRVFSRLCAVRSFHFSRNFFDSNECSKSNRRKRFINSIASQFDFSSCRLAQMIKSIENTICTT